jgi:uncharacterized protein (DUF433 family)
MPDTQAFITHAPDVQGGEPVLCGTRTPVRTVVILYERVYDHDEDEVRRALPHLSAAQIDAALAYGAQHRPEIERHIERHARIARSHVRSVSGDMLFMPFQLPQRRPADDGERNEQVRERHEQQRGGDAEVV